MFIEALCCCLHWARTIQSVPLDPVSIRIILKLFLVFYWPTSRFFTKIRYSCLFYPMHSTCTANVCKNTFKIQASLVQKFMNDILGNYMYNKFEFHIYLLLSESHISCSFRRAYWAYREHAAVSTEIINKSRSYYRLINNVSGLSFWETGSSFC